MMMGTKFDIEKFDEMNNFRLWQVRMKALLEQHGLAAALEELSATIIVAYDNVIQKKAYNALILCLADRVLLEITTETTAAGIWRKLETLYMTKYLANRDLAAIDIAISNEDQALLLLTSLSSSYDNFVKTLLYGWDTLKLEDVLTTLNSRELQKIIEAKGDGGEGLYVRGRSGQINIEQGKDSMWSKSQGRSSRLRNEDQVSGSKADSADVMMVINVEQLLDWIMDSGGSYHMTYKRDYLFDFEEYDGDMEDDVDISALTMEQYIALIPDDIKPGIVNPKIGDDVEFEINANFMRELRRKLFAGTDDEDAYEHVRTVLEIVDLFHFPGVTHDAIMLRVFPITLKGRALRWKNRLPAGTITTWDLLKKEFIWRYCHPFITAKKLEEIYNLKQERDETLYHAWERYNDLLYQCPMHDLNCQQKVHIFYTGLDISTRKILNSNRFIPLMTPTQALESIQVMADHSHDWYDETNTRERINDVLDNVDAIHEREKVKAITTMGNENMKEPVPRDLPPTPFLGHLKKQMGSPYKTHETVRLIRNPEEIHNEKAQEDEGDMDVGWDITSKDVERLRQFLTPTIHTLPNLEPVVQPYIPLGPVHDKDKIVREEEQEA
ncbi:reverse transcriptase domain-containing protein [Tanacetum coccineum]